MQESGPRGRPPACTVESEKRGLGCKWSRGLQVLPALRAAGPCGAGCSGRTAAGPESVPGPLPPRLVACVPACSWGICVCGPLT